jgi:hypothetical protein
MGQRSRLLHALSEHRYSPSNALIYKNHENFVLIAEKNRAAATGRNHCADLNFDNGRTHTPSLAGHCLYAKIRIAVYKPVTMLPTRMEKSLTSPFCVKAHNFGAGDDTRLSSGWNCPRPILRVTLGVKIRQSARINDALIKIEDREERDPDNRYIVRVES